MTTTTSQAGTTRSAVTRRQARVGLWAAAGLCATFSWPSAAEASQALAQKYACVACHQPAARTAGPSWTEIAARYGQVQGGAAQLATSIKAGGSGKWGAMPMPPQARVSDTDAQALAQWLIDGAK